MKRHIIILLTALISISSLATPLEQNNRKRDQVCNREKIESARIAFFTTELEISPDEAAEFWAIYNDYADERASAKRKVRSIIQKIKDLTNQKGHVSDLEYKKVIKEYHDAHKAIDVIDELYYEEFFKIIGPERSARLVIAEENFRREMIQVFHQEHKKQNTPKEISKK